MFSRLTFFLMSLVGTINAGIEQHFQPALNKTGSSSISNVDFIYIINLDQRPEKFAYCAEQLESFGIHPYRFSAVNGWELKDEALDDLGVCYQPGMKKGLMGTYFPHHGPQGGVDEAVSTFQRSYYCFAMTRGAIGIVMSHLSILQDAYDAGYETIWVMEDDVQVIRNPHDISEAITKLDLLVGENGWDILFTDRDTKGKNGQYVICRSFAPRPNFEPANPLKFAKKPQKISPEFRRVFARYGAYSMIIRRSGMKKLLDFFKTYKVYLPYDMDFYLPEDIKLYSVLSDIVSTKPDALSDNRYPTY